MKTTSLKISKQLAEVGFKAETDFSWNREIINCGSHSKEHFFIKYNNGWSSGEVVCSSYELETIIDRFPLKIGGYGYFSMGARKDNPSMPFAVGYNLECDEDFGMLFCDQIKGELLADTAARLLILLREKNLIKL
jgi:hypothetical protein